MGREDDTIQATRLKRPPICLVNDVQMLMQRPEAAVILPVSRGSGRARGAAGSRLRALWTCLAIACGPAGSAQGASVSGTRLGLVIGEARYEVGALATTANDAGAVAQSLASVGFDVTGYADLDRAGLRRAFAGFLDKARRAGPEATVFVYLAGFGLQFDGGNFMAPVEARLARDVDVPAEAVSLDDLARDLAALPLKARVLVYDAARANPFARNGSVLTRGLAITEPPPGTILAFNAAPGTVAGNEPGDYGRYAEALSEMLQTRGLSLETVFARLRLRVAAASEGRDVPWSDGSVDGSASLLPPVSETTSLLQPLKTLVSGSTATEAFWIALKRDSVPGYREFLKSYPGDAFAPRIGALLAQRREAAIWSQARRVNVATAYWTYMRFYPRGPHFADARRLLAALPAALEPPPRFEVYAFADLPQPRPEEVALLKAETAATPVPPPPVADLPVRRLEFYERLPPLLAVYPGSLPLAVPIPLTRPVEPGHVVQPGFDDASEVVTATNVADKGGNLTVVQTGRDGRVLSTASITLEPNGGRSLVQTGPDHQPIATVVDHTEPNGRRTVVQTGWDKQVISKSVTETASDGSRTVTLSGPQGVVTVATTNTAGVAATPSQPTVTALTRPPLIAALRPRTTAAAPVPSSPAKPTIAATMPLPNLTDGAPALRVEPPKRDDPAKAAGLAEAAPAPAVPAPIPSLSGTGSPTIDLPNRTSAQPLGPPVVPVESVPLNPPVGIALPVTRMEPPPSPPPRPAPAAPVRVGEATPSPSQPVPPRRTAEAAPLRPSTVALKEKARETKTETASKAGKPSPRGRPAAGATRAGRPKLPAKPAPSKRARHR